MIATKGGIDPGAERTRDSGREFLRAGVESSLRAMKIDHIDLYQVHWPDPQTPFEDTAGYLQELVDEGKIRHVGVSNFDEQQMAAFERGAARRDAAAALPPLPPVAWRSDLALRARARHRRARLQPAGLGPARPAR